MGLKKSFLFNLLFLIYLLFFIPIIFLLIEKDKNNYVLEHKGLNVLIESCNSKKIDLINYFNYTIISKNPLIFRDDKNLTFYSNCEINQTN